MQNVIIIMLKLVIEILSPKCIVDSTDVMHSIVIILTVLLHDIIIPDLNKDNNKNFVVVVETNLSVCAGQHTPFHS